MSKQLFVPSPELTGKIDARSENVLALLQEIDYHGVMRTYHIFESFPTRNKSNLYNQLNRLFHHGYIGRDSEFDYRKHRYKGSLPFFYWIRPRGKYALAEHDRPYTGDIDYDPDPPSPIHLPHELAITTFMVKVKMYALRYGLRFITHYEILNSAPPETQARMYKAKDSPFRFVVKAMYNSTLYECITATPDKVFGIERQDKRKAYFLPEIDMGVGQPLSRPTPFPSSIRKKYVVYDAVFEQELHKKQLNIPNFRVPFVTNKGALRAKNIIEETRRTQGKNIFFSGSLRDIEDPYLYEWETRNGEKITLFGR
jgi:hypothetical protein